jgi:hypothetical protein
MEHTTGMNAANLLLWKQQPCVMMPLQAMLDQQERLGMAKKW